MNLDEIAIAQLGEGKKPRILLLDLETAASRGDYFDRAKEYNILRVTQDWFIFMYSYKWLDEKTVRAESMWDYGYDSQKPDDFPIVEKLWHLFNEADVIIAHNGDRFDVPKSKTRFIIHGLPPPTPYQTVDTKKIAKGFGFESNKLDELGRQLGLGRKLETGGQRLWDGCRDGDPKAWQLMKKYNKQDVVLLEQVYLKLRGWYKPHPNLGLLTRNESCPNCQSKRDQWNKNGFSYKATGRHQRYACRVCGNTQIIGEKIEMAKVATRNA